MRHSYRPWGSWARTVGRNIRIDYRWGAGNVERYRTFAEELVALGPDVILGNGTATVNALRNATRTVPIVFASITDPVRTGAIKQFQAHSSRFGKKHPHCCSRRFRIAAQTFSVVTPTRDVMRDLVATAISANLGVFRHLRAVRFCGRFMVRPNHTLRLHTQVQKSMGSHSEFEAPA